MYTPTMPADLQASVPAAPVFRGFATRNPEAALEMMDRQGIGTAILSMVLPTAMFGADDAAGRVARSSNEAAAEAIRSHPGRFGGFACLRCQMWTLRWRRSTTRWGRCGWTAWCC